MSSNIWQNHFVIRSTTSVLSDFTSYALTAVSGLPVLSHGQTIVAVFLRRAKNRGNQLHEIGFIKLETIVSSKKCRLFFCFFFLFVLLGQTFYFFPNDFISDFVPFYFALYSPIGQLMKISCSLHDHLPLYTRRLVKFYQNFYQKIL
jgi:hypothetical protein